MKSYVIIVLLFLLAIDCVAKDDKAAQKNKKAVEKEESRFEKNLEKNPNSAAPYLEHANNLSAIISEYNRAGGFYLLAIKHDSANADIYKDYGIYLTDKMHSFPEAKTVLEKGLALSPADEVIKKYLADVNKILALQDADNKLRDFGVTIIKENNPTGNFASISNFDSLKLLALTPGNKYYYPDMAAKFLADDKNLTAADIYMLIIGFSTQKSYSAFSYNDINEMKMLAGYNLDSAISRGKELVKTNPLNPTLNRELMYYYRKKNQPGEADKYLIRIQQFFNGVLYSGNGTCDRPYVSLWSKEEYNFLTYLGYKATETHYMGACAGHMAEIIDAVNNTTQKTEPVHFNVGLIYMQSVGK